MLQNGGRLDDHHADFGSGCILPVVPAVVPAIVPPSWASRRYPSHHTPQTGPTPLCQLCQLGQPRCQ